jgi:hypothetical protein
VDIQTDIGTALATGSFVVAVRWAIGPMPVALELRQSGASTTTLLPVEGHVRFRVLSGRRCTGWVDFACGVVRPCPQDAAVDSSHQCESCRRLEGYGPCMLCNGSQCPPLPAALARFCQGPHHLYIACFGERWVKVGTTALSRRHQRVLEQGPLAVAFVAAASGPIIKRMEHLLGQRGYVTRVSRATKFRLLSSPMSEADARDCVATAAEKLDDVLAPEHRAWLTTPEFVERPPIARAADGCGKIERLRDIDDLHLDTRVVAARGPWLVIEDGAGLSALDLTSLRGKNLDFSPLSPPQPRVTQLSLF